VAPGVVVVVVIVMVAVTMEMEREGGGQVGGAEVVTPEKHLC